MGEVVIEMLTGRMLAGTSESNHRLQGGDYRGTRRSETPTRKIRCKGEDMAPVSDQIFSGPKSTGRGGFFFLI